VKGQEELRQECNRDRRKWGKFVRVSARRGEGMCRGQQEVGNECERDSRRWGRCVMVTAGRGQECERFSWKCSRSVNGSAGSGAGL